MPTSPEALTRFLTAEPVPAFHTKGRSEGWLLNFIATSFHAEPQFKSKPRETQIQGLAFGLWAKRVLFYWDPRTGKTKLALDWLSFLRQTGRVARALIIPHAPIGVDEWDGQYEQHCDLKLAFIRSGPNSFDELCDALDSDCDAVVATWSTLQQLFAVKRMMPRKKKMKLYPDLDKIRAVAEFFDCVIIDEIHLAAEPGSLRFQIVEELIAYCEWRAGLTGTPFGRDPFKLWAQAYLMDGGETLSGSYYFFQEAFGIERYNHFNRRKSEFVFPKQGTKEYDESMEILRAKLDHMVMPLALSEIQDTNVLSGIIRLRMSSEQRAAYSRLISQHVDRLQSMNQNEMENVYVRLRQIASGYLPFQDPDTGDRHIIEFTDACKLVWLEDFFRELREDVKCVIFHEFTHSGRMITKLLGKLKIRHGWIYGGTKQHDRVFIKGDFQNGTLPVVVSNSATGGTSIDLSAADYLLFFESPSGVTRRQAESRPLARGERLLVMDDMVCAPVEEKLLGYAQEGKDLLNDLLRSPRGLRDLAV